MPKPDIVVHSEENSLDDTSCWMLAMVETRGKPVKHRPSTRCLFALAK